MMIRKINETFPLYSPTHFSRCLATQKECVHQSSGKAIASPLLKPKHCGFLIKRQVHC